MWCLAVAMPAVQADLGVSRADISFAYSMNMLGFFAGGVAAGRLVDRRGIVVTSIVSAIGLALGFALAPTTSSLVLFAAAQVLIGFSAAATFAPAGRRHLALVREAPRRRRRHRRLGQLHRRRRSGRRSSS